MTDQQIIAKLDKTRNTINAYIARGGRFQTVRAWELIRRYDDLREGVACDGDYAQAWVAYCTSTNACPSHTGFDLFG